MMVKTFKHEEVTVMLSFEGLRDSLIKSGAKRTDILSQRWPLEVRTKRATRQFKTQTPKTTRIITMKSPKGGHITLPSMLLLLPVTIIIL